MGARSKLGKLALIALAVLPAAVSVSCRNPSQYQAENLMEKLQKEKKIY